MDYRSFAKEIDRTLHTPANFLMFLSSMGASLIPDLAKAFEQFAIPNKEQRFQQVFPAYIALMLSPDIEQEKKNDRTQALSLFLMQYLLLHRTMMDEIRQGMVKAKMDPSIIPMRISLWDFGSSEIKQVAKDIERRLNEPLLFWLFVMSKESSMTDAVFAFDQYEIDNKEARFLLAFNAFTAIMALPTLPQQEKEALVMGASQFVRRFMVYHAAKLESLRVLIEHADGDASLIPMTKPLQEV